MTPALRASSRDRLRQRIAAEMYEQWEASAIRTLMNQVEVLEERAHFAWHTEVDAGRVLECPDCKYAGKLMRDWVTIRNILSSWSELVICRQCGRSYTDPACDASHAEIQDVVRMAKSWSLNV